MKDLYKNSEEVLRAQSIQIDSLKHKLEKYYTASRITETIMPELKVLFPFVEEASCSQTYIMKTADAESDTILLVYLKCKDHAKVTANDKQKINEWLSARVKMNNIKLLIE